MSETIRIGFVALTDCAPLVVAQEAGFFREQGIGVELVRQASWDFAERRLVDGTLHASHVLATFPIRATLALVERPAPLCTAWVLSRGGNAVTVSNAVWKVLSTEPSSIREALAERLPLRVGVIHRYSPHEYHLRTWLSGLGLDPDRDGEWIVVPPQEMVGRLRDGMMEAFCAGEPWNQRASTSKLGAIAALGNDLLPGRAEKVLAVRQDWHRMHAAEHAALLRALDRAGRFLSDPANLATAADWLASDPYVNSVRDLLLSDLRGDIDAGFRRRLDAPGFLRFHGEGVNVPREEDARSWLESLVEWGHCPPALLDADLSAIHLEGFHRSALG